MSGCVNLLQSEWFPGGFPVVCVLRYRTLHHSDWSITSQNHRINSMWTPSQVILAVWTDYFCLTMTVIIHYELTRNPKFKLSDSFRALNRDFIFQRTLLRVACSLLQKASVERLDSQRRQGGHAAWAKRAVLSKMSCLLQAIGGRQDSILQESIQVPQWGCLPFNLHEELQKQCIALVFGCLQCFSSKIPLPHCKSALDKCLLWKVSVLMLEPGNTASNFLKRSAG